MKEVIKYSVLAVYYIAMLLCFLFGSPLLKVLAVILLIAELYLKFITKVVDFIYNMVRGK